MLSLNRKDFGLYPSKQLGQLFELLEQIDLLDPACLGNAL